MTIGSRRWHTVLTKNQLPAHERQLFDEIEAHFGRLNNIFRVLAHHPVLLRQVIDCGVALRHETRLTDTRVVH